MKALLWLDWRTATRSGRAIVTLLLVLLLSVGFGPIARHQRLGDLSVTALRTKDRIKVGVNEVEHYYTSRLPKLRRTSALLNQQWQASNAIGVGVKFHDEAAVRAGMLTLGRLEKRGAQVGYAGVRLATMPSVAEGQRKVLVAQSLSRRREGMHTQVSDAASTLEQWLPLLATALPFLLLLLTADVWLAGAAHGSITTSVPVAGRAQAVSKLVTRLALPVGLMVIAIVGTGLTAALRFGVGDLSYPIAVALGARLTLVPLWGAALLLLGWTLVEGLFICALMLVFNLWLRNVYWSFVAGALIALVPLVAPSVARALWFTPLAGLAPQSILAGTLQNEAGNWALGLGGAAGVLLAWTVGLIALFSWQLTHHTD